MNRAVRNAAIVLAALLLAAAAAVLVLRTSTAHTRGIVDLPADPPAARAGGGSPGAEVRIVRDVHGVPHIEAASRRDAVFGLGFAHAQDRLWQMELQRRVGSGTLAELVGPAGLSVDRFFRTLGTRRAAEAALGHLDAEERAVLDAYIAGVNAFLQARTGVLPPEFLLLGVRPEPWSAVDVVVWQKALAWDMTGAELTSEALRARLIAALGAERAGELFPPSPDDGGAGPPTGATGVADGVWEALAAHVPAARPENGSNAWAVSAARSATPRPLLANDPHLELQAPSQWYLAHLRAPGYEVVGATLPGTPAVLLGHNGRVAWSLTNTGSDVLDLYVERVDPEDPGSYVTPEGPRAFDVRRETIAVKGAEDVILDVRSTRHGPVVSDVVPAAEDAAGEGHVVALRWTALDEDDTTIGAALRMTEADDWDAFVAALERWVVPQQTILYADVDGNIGMIAAARIPVRAAGDGAAPSPGWTGEHEWVGTVPFDELPRVANPADGVLVAANQRPVGPGYPHHLDDDWPAPYRADRIAQLLARTPRHTLDTFAAIQADVVSLHAREHLPLLRSVTPSTAVARDALAALDDWNGEMRAEAPGPLIFSAWYRALVREIAEDELGGLFDAWYGFRPAFVASALTERTHWCDDVRTSPTESCGDIAARALRLAAAELAEAHGSDPSAWRWGDVHRARLVHPAMGGTALARLFDLTAPNDGGPFTVDVGSYAIRRPYAQNHGPGFRALYDLADLERSRFVQATGQSGNPLSTRYRDLFPLWLDNGYLPVSTDPDAYAGGRAQVLVLRPAR